MTNEESNVTIWESALPLFSRRMLGQWTGAIGATALVTTLLLTVIFGASGEWTPLPPLLALILGACGGLWLLGWLIMLVVFQGEYRMRFTLSDRGIRCETIDRAATAANRLAIVAGLLGRRPQAAGAGLIGVAREAEEVRWTGAFRAVFDPAHASITVRNAWRTLMWIQCTPENYPTVAAAIAAHMETHATAARVSSRSPIRTYVGRSALVVAACLPLFALAEPFDAGVFLPILILCFGLATVWMINLFGWVVLGGLVIEAFLVLGNQLELRQSTLFRGESYRRYEVLGPDDIGLLVMAAIGASILVWLSIGALRGRWLSALLEGDRDMGDS